MKTQREITLKNIRNMLKEDEFEFTKYVDMEFNTLTELHKAAANLKTTIYLISMIALSKLSYTSFAHKTINTLANMMSTGIIDREKPILITLAGTPGNLFSLLKSSIIDAINGDNSMCSIDDKSSVNVYANLVKYNEEAIDYFKTYRTQDTLVKIIGNLMSILNLIGQMATRVSSSTIRGMNTIGNIAYRLSVIDPFVDVSSDTDITRVISTLSSSDVDILVDDSDTSILDKDIDNYRELTVTYLFMDTPVNFFGSTPSGTFHMLPDGKGILNGEESYRISSVHFGNGTRGVQFSFRNYCVYLMDNGGIYVSRKGSNTYYR